GGPRLPGSVPGRGTAAVRLAAGRGHPVDLPEPSRRAGRVSRRARLSARAGHGLSEDGVLFFERATLQHACLRLDAAWREHAAWRTLLPLAQTVFGRAEFLDWLRAEHGERVPAGLLR